MDPSIGRFISVDKLADHPNQVDKSTYAYAWNNPVGLNDPDGNCPWCLGALVGAALDYGSQVTVNLVQGKSLGDALTDVDGTSILVSAAAGATGVGIAQNIKNFGTAAKLATEVVADGVISVTSQAITEGDVNLKNVVVDATAGQAGRKLVGKKLGEKAANSKKGKALQAKVNTEKNIARGKSRKQRVKKTDANIKSAEAKRDNFKAGRGALGAGAAAGSTRKAVKAVTNDEEKNN